MRTLGWVFLGGYTLDAVLSAIASYLPGLLLMSNLISTAMIVFTIIAFVLALLGKMEPRMVFVLLCSYYFLMLVFGGVLSVLLVMKLGPEKVQNVEISPQFFREQFDWYGPVHWGLLIVWLFLAVFGVVFYGRNQAGAEPGVTPPDEGR